jgi:hypothetical protein
MNLEYISGFFDADGSITMSKNRKNDKFRAIKIDFTNTDLPVLLEIQSFLLQSYNLKLSLSLKPARKANYSTSYSLSLNSSQKCIELCKLINSRHLKKTHRINTILKYHNLVTLRNGKYSNKESFRKLAYERLFFCPNFH